MLPVEYCSFQLNNMLMLCFQKVNLVYTLYYTLYYGTTFSCTCVLLKQLFICLLFIVLFAKNCTTQIKSNYLNSHAEEAQEKPPGL